MVTTALREKMRAILRARNYSPRTEETYVSAVGRFARHFGASPDQLGAEQVVSYQLWLRDEKHASHVLFNQTMCALRFFYGEVLERHDVVEPHSLRPPRATATGRTAGRRDHRSSQSSRSTSIPCPVDDHLRHWSPAQRGSRVTRLGHRLQGDGCPRPPRQREEGSLRATPTASAGDAP
jgi:hypothetical protein